MAKNAFGQEINTISLEELEALARLLEIFLAADGDLNDLRVEKTLLYVKSVINDSK